MWALPQRCEKATATLWKHDRYRYRYRYNFIKFNNIFLRKIKKFSGSVTVTVAVMLRLFPYNVAVAILLRYGCVFKILALR